MSCLPQGDSYHDSQTFDLEMKIRRRIKKLRVSSIRLRFRLTIQGSDTGLLAVYLCNEKLSKPLAEPDHDLHWTGISLTRNKQDL